MTAWETLAAMIHRSLVMISFTALIPQAPRSAMMALATRSGWPPAQNGLVAATWMHGNGTPARYIECMEFFLAPYPIGGGQGDPTKAPDITINSWGCPASEGCSANTLQAAVEAQAAAGIMMVVAAGNSGSACSTVSDPPRFMQHLTPSAH